MHSLTPALLPNAEHHHDSDVTDVFGFWLYIMTDCILFACLFATYIVLHQPGIAGPVLKNYLNLYDILIETFLLLASNFTFCLAILSMYNESSILKIEGWLLCTFLFGLGFIVMELTEFRHLVQLGFSWEINGAASAFFTLVGTHGLHVSLGLFWIMLLMLQIYVFKNDNNMIRRMTYLGLFWNFLDIVWIFVFTLVYLVGAI